ncbi:MAG: bifunctional (p)ppGpp synthetase/guanosine-3',5'-bis(diphosphate) 3'-pyrophosphohydrolase [Akkermansiaceae bacterium]|nr:bifunctional (p)ppGpp synthetase/guanosine-3',5'-bis(diphosphate) 3'-pyrophosphohydrolase [Akkermansiaceae bacterium]
MYEQGNVSAPKSLKRLRKEVQWTELDPDLWALVEQPESRRAIREAISFAAREHRHHKRKDGETPYVAHVMRVAMTVAHVFGVQDIKTLTAAVLHDTIEDTGTDYDDLLEQFGKEVADLVVCLTKDPRMVEEEREEEYFEGLARAPWQARLIKLADSYDNVLDSSTSKVRTKAAAKARKILEIAGDDRPELAGAKAALEGLIAAMES